MPCILKLNNGTYSDLNMDRVYLSCSGEGTRKGTLTCQNLNKKVDHTKVAMILLLQKAYLICHVQFFTTAFRQRTVIFAMCIYCGG